MTNLNDTAVAFEVNPKAFLNFCLTHDYILNSGPYSPVSHPAEIDKLEESNVEIIELVVGTYLGNSKFKNRVNLTGNKIFFNKELKRWYAVNPIPDLSKFTPLDDIWDGGNIIPLEFIDSDDAYDMTNIDDVFYNYYRVNVYKNNNGDGYYTTREQLMYLEMNGFIDFIRKFKIGEMLSSLASIVESTIEIVKIIGLYKDEKTFNILSDKIKQLKETGLVKTIIKMDNHGVKAEYFNIDILPDWQISQVRDAVIVLHDLRNSVSYRIVNENAI